MTHVYVSKLTIIASHNGLFSGRRQAIIWTNAGILLIWTFGTNISEIVSESYTFSYPTVFRPAMGTAFIMEFHNQGFVSIIHSLTVSLTVSYELLCYIDIYRWASYKMEFMNDGESIHAWTLPLCLIFNLVIMSLYMLNMWIIVSCVNCV